MACKARSQGRNVFTAENTELAVDMQASFLCSIGDLRGTILMFNVRFMLQMRPQDCSRYFFGSGFLCVLRGKKENYL
jgi:hypothetical protein